jgi:hypothetical protein
MNLGRPKIGKNCKMDIKVDGSLKESLRTFRVLRCFQEFRVLEQITLLMEYFS